MTTRYLLLFALVCCGGCFSSSDGTDSVPTADAGSTDAAASPPDLPQSGEREVPENTGSGGETPAPETPPASEPEKLADVPADGDTVTLHLYVSNQSFDEPLVEIDVWLDDTHVVTGGFDVAGQHNWILFDLEVPAGTHEMHAEAMGGAVIIDETLDIPEERWAVLDFWYYPGETDHPMFTWLLSETPVGFQ